MRVRGAVLQKSTNGFGHFLGTNLSGCITIQPTAWGLHLGPLHEDIPNRQSSDIIANGQ